MALVSMTGFGQAERSSGAVQIGIEVKTVNHRFLDIAWRLPQSYSRFENELAKIVREKFKRGRIDITVSRRQSGASDFEIFFDEALFKQYLPVLKSALKGALAKEQDSLGAAVVNLLQRREILDLVPKDTDVKAELGVLKEALSEAIDRTQKMREVEGKELERDLAARLNRLEQLSGEILPKTEGATAGYRERLTARIEKLQLEVQIDAARLAQEVAVFAERSDVSEEVSRLASHVAQFRQSIKDNGGGRKLDFLIQEMGREVNTTGSKSQSVEITALVVEAKAELEKIREQVQNVE